MLFHEAYAEIKAGKKVARPGFKGYWYENPETGKLTIHLPSGKEISYGNLDIMAKNCAATDWEVVDQPAAQ